MDTIKVLAKMLDRLINRYSIFYINPYSKTPAMHNIKHEDAIVLANSISIYLELNANYDKSNISNIISNYMTWATKVLHSNTAGDAQDLLLHTKEYFKDFAREVKETHNNDIWTAEQEKQAKTRIAFLQSSTLRFGSDEERQEALDEIRSLHEKILDYNLAKINEVYSSVV